MQAQFEKITKAERESFLAQEFRLPRFRHPWHFHPELELTFIVQSQGQRFVGDHIAPFRAGDLVLIGSNLPHLWYNDHPSRQTKDYAQAIVIQFVESFMGPEFFNQPEMSSIARLLTKASRGILFTGKTRDTVAEQMRQLLSLKGPARVIQMLSILETLASTSHSELLSSPAYAPSLNAFDEQRLNRIHQYIQDHFAEPIHQPDVASSIHMTSPAFSRFFRKKTGKTFTAFVNELRIGRACQLLTHNEFNITEIAFRCGFENLSNFNRRFLKLKRMSPRAYRREFQNADKG
jgi:AraC-like DNA-binding protein